jgi:transmembrane sensor
MSDIQSMPLQRFHPSLLVAVALLIAIPAAVFFFIAPANNDQAGVVKSYSTAEEQEQALRLDDGSEVRLSENTAVAVRYSDDQRRVQLSRGEATFVIAPDQRPFWVQAGTLRLNAGSSAFAVRMNPESTVLHVIEGEIRAQSQGKVQTFLAGATVVLANN